MNNYNQNKFRVIFILFLLITLPLSVLILQNSQSFRSKAAGGANLTFNPASQTKNIGQTGSFAILLNPNGANVSGVELYLNYNPAVVTVNSISPGAFFTDPASTVGQPIEITKKIQNGTIHYTLAFPLGSNY